MLTVLAAILASIVLMVLILYLLPVFLMRPLVRLFPNAGVSIHYRLYYTARLVSRAVLQDYTSGDCSLDKDQFGRTRVRILNDSICVSPDNWLACEVLSLLAGELAPKLGFERGRASVHEEETVFVFSDADSLY